MNLFYQPLLSEGVTRLTEEESRHCTKVLRKRTGDIIDITDGKGTLYKGKIIELSAHQCHVEIISSVRNKKKDYSIHIAIAPTKNLDRTEWFVEKCTEIGIDEITFLKCKNSERTQLRLDRIERIAISAMKQSLKTNLPLLHDLVSFPGFVKEASVQQKFIAYVDIKNPSHLMHVAQPKQNYLVLIGPEGDFTTEELTMANDHGFIKISLGETRLRTETAGMAACHMLQLINL